MRRSRWLTLAIFWLAGASAQCIADADRKAGGPSPSGSEENLELLVKQFSSADTAEQEQAGSRLCAIGKRALGLVRELESSKDAKLGARAKELAAEIVARSSGPLSISGSRFFDGDKLVVYVSEGNARRPRSDIFVRDVANDRDVICLRGTPPRTGRIDISPDGNHLAVPGGRRDGTVLDAEDYWIGIWDWRRAKLISKLRGHTDGVYTAVFSPDGSTVASAGLDGTIRFWNSKNGVETARLDAHGAWVCHILYSPDGKQLLSCGDDGLIKLWDVGMKKELVRLETRTRVSQLAYSPDGEWAAAILAGSGFRQLPNMEWANLHGGILVLDMKARRIHKQIDYTRATLRSVAIENGGKRLLTGDDQQSKDQQNWLILWDVATGQEVGHAATVRAGVTGTCFMRGGKEAWAMDSTGHILKWILPH